MKNNSEIKTRYYVICFLLGLSLMIASCEKILDVDMPKSKIIRDNVFADDITATSAIVAIYQDMINPVAFSSGSNNSITNFAGLSADELIVYNRTDPSQSEILDIEQNRVSIDNSPVYGLWTSMYKIIYEANAVIEGVRASQKLSPNVARQLEGEALFIRAFTHFYLVNLFGDVPLVITTSYETNAHIKRSPFADVYEQIVSDLQTAKDLMPVEYVTSGRVRPNKLAASALLARVYLYQSNWAKAEEESSFVMSQPQVKLLTDMNQVFKTNSEEAIWQIQTIIADFNTWDGYYFVVTFIGPMASVMNPELAFSFEAGDQRYNNWVGTFDTGNGTGYFPYKYKGDLFSFGTTEYTTILRKAELYLIRAEARLMQDNLEGAIEDVDEIRYRAGLDKLSDTDPNINKDDLLSKIDHERRIELFTEWGHRWFDIKRRGTATQVLSPIKPDWSADDMLYPVPAIEFEKNPLLGDQNPGY